MGDRAKQESIESGTIMVVEITCSKSIEASRTVLFIFSGAELQLLECRIPKNTTTPPEVLSYEHHISSSNGG